MGISTVGCVDKASMLEVLEAADRSLLLRLSPTGPLEAEVVEAHVVGAEAAAAEPADAEPDEAGAPPEPPLAEGELPEEVVERLEELRGMRLRDLRRALTSLGLRTEGCVDRESLVEILEREGPAAVLRVHRAKKEPHKGGGYAMPDIPKTQACSPKRGKAEVPIYMMRSVGQYGVKGGATRVITLDVECGPAAGPTRFLLDTVSEHSLIKEKVAKRIGGKAKGVPDWAKGADAHLNIHNVNLANCWLAKLNCGELEIASIAGGLPVPTGVAGILGLDFLRQFDWDFDFVACRATVQTVPRDGLGPVPFDVAGMRLVPLMPVRTPLQLLACPVILRVPGQEDAEVDCMGIVDLGAASSMCNTDTAHKLGLCGPAEPYKPRTPPPPKKEKAKGFSAPEPEPSFEERELELDIGKGADGPVRVETGVFFGDIEVFETMRLAYNFPAAILGPDALCRSRLILSPRLQSIWLPASD